MSNIQLIGKPSGEVWVVCATHPEFQVNLGRGPSPSVAFRIANSHYMGAHMERNGLPAHQQVVEQ